jgi:hypothetical protein
VSVRYEGRFRPFNGEPPAKAEANREVVRILPVPDVGAEAKGERAIQREALAVADHLSPGISAKEMRVPATENRTYA